jgi:hypothetical protein
MKHDPLIPFLLLMSGIFGASLVIFLTYAGFELANFILRQL